MRRGDSMARVTITIRHVAWRDGRPRFVPGPKHRAIGLKGQDLKRPDGRWMSAEEARTWVEGELLPRITAIKEAKAAGRRAPRAKRPSCFTVEDLFEAFWRAPKVTGEGGSAAAKRRVLSPATIRDYRSKARALAEFAPDLYGSDVAALTKPILIGLHEKLWAAKGHRMANAMLSVLRLALSYGVRKGLGGLTANPALQMGLEGTPERLRVGTIAEMETLIRAADAIDEPMVGHAIMLGLMTGQRQTDRLGLQDAGEREGWRTFRQSKTGALVSVPETPQLAVRLAAAREHRTLMGVSIVNVLVDPARRLAYTADTYPKAYRRVRAAAVEGVRDEAGAWRVKPCPSLADFRDQDLRDTAVTWLANAGATEAQIRAITGHDLQTIGKILKHYMAITPEQASAAILKLVTYLEQQGAAL
jgi:hypothetical protein